MLFDKLNPVAFAISLGIGLMLVYMVTPKPKLVVQFPSPLNAGKIVYRDASQNCYVYESEKVPCVDGAKTAPVSKDEEETAALSGTVPLPGQ